MSESASEPHISGSSLATPSAGTLDRALGGDLKCIVCGYNLKGISIRGRCPECGVQIRATILAIVDPLASELRPIPRPRAVASGLVVWAVCALLATLLSWAPLLVDAAAVTGVWRAPRPQLGMFIGGLVCLGGIAAVGFARPHAGVPGWITLSCVVGTVLSIPLALLLVRIDDLAQQGSTTFRYLHGWRPVGDESALAAGAAFLLATVLLLFRPVIRVLVARSVVMRTGRVDRQTMYALAASAAIIAIGHGLGYASTQGPGFVFTMLRSLALAIIMLGALLLTIGFAGGLADAVRIAGAVLLPSPGLRTVITKGHDPKSALRMLASRGPSQPVDQGSSANAVSSTAPSPGPAESSKP